ncbi:MAG: hypothetical protein LBR49_08205 [Tannerella sp.]|jgi:hypothetical protein|nr:hypothetical protein [Tannerella sp.]
MKKVLLGAMTLIVLGLAVSVVYAKDKPKKEAPKTEQCCKEKKSCCKEGEKKACCKDGEKKTTCSEEKKAGSCTKEKE